MASWPRTKAGRQWRAEKRALERGKERESIERERQLAAFSRDDAPNRRFGSLRRRRGRSASCISVLHYMYRGGTRIHTHSRVYGRATMTNTKERQQSGRVRA